MGDPPLLAGAVQDNKNEVIVSLCTERFVGGSGTVAGAVSGQISSLGLL
jgi:hypothetical protein